MVVIIYKGFTKFRYDFNSENECVDYLVRRLSANPELEYKIYRKDTCSCKMIEMILVKGE